MKFQSLLAVVTAMILTFGAYTARGQQARPASFADFDARATAGEPLSVVFFGGSLSWGANASDPQTTSYRGLMMQYLRTKYPKTSFAFWDATIGGTGSGLGIFRTDRDVLVHKPDLVFLDFTANDGLENTNVGPLKTYESLLRRLIGQGIPVEQVIMGFKYNFGTQYNPDHTPRRTDHIKLSDAYHTAMGDCFPYVQQKLTDGTCDIKTLWPFDQAHPDDPGYQLFFESARDGYEKAIADKRVCAVPETPMYGDDFMQPHRMPLVDLPAAPKGWTRSKTYRTGMWYDGMSSRWMGDVLLCDIKTKADVEPLKVEFSGTFVGLLGEGDADGLPFKVMIDGAPVLYHPNPKVPPKAEWPSNPSPRPEGAITVGVTRLFIWRELATDLKPGKHQLEIDPIFPEASVKGQLRIESVCAGGKEQ